MTGVSAPVVLLAAALLAVPAGATAAGRLDRLTGRPTAAGRPRWAGIGRALAGTAVAGWVRRSSLADRRRTAEPLRLAATWDLLAACLRSGLPVPTAIRAVAGTAPAQACRALGATAELLALGAGHVEAWAPAQAEPATAELARAACRTARSGAALAEVARDLSVRLRAATGDDAEARAQRAGVLITGPLGLCFLPAFLCLGVIPVVLGLASRMTVMH
jgi:pilus assembly protein TadC